MKEKFDKISLEASKMVTREYSTSFSLAIRMFNKRFRDPVYSIYGFVRLADEIVDTFHDFEKDGLLESLKEETYRAIDTGISINPLINSFQSVVNRYGIERDLIESFIASMEMDLYKKDYKPDEYKKYIVGSAEVVGLMCLRVITEGDNEKYQQLKLYARHLGSALQKINFLRDINTDYSMGRVYFPGIDIDSFTQESKQLIEKDIELDMQKGYSGMRQLPRSAQMGIYLAYKYFSVLLDKIKKTPPEKLFKERIRISNARKYWILLLAVVGVRQQ